ncbi:hypothetical protein A9Q79_07920 [Methylophaga sp. 42_25_T18]|nr:hypothetical protein A9Q79_07920 [Methylophaga sp. 42_25_T18]
MTYELSSIQNERTLRLNALKNEGKGATVSFLKFIEVRFDGDDYQRVYKAYQYAINIDYDHVGLSSSTYLVHPLRVAEMAMGLVPPVDIDSIIIALLHNVLEVGGGNLHELEEKFGKQVSNSISTLTVDRKQQSDPVYKADYYQKINAGYKGMKIVKVLDKLDNIFMLGLNPDKDVREAYLDEIDQFIIPMAESVLPHLVEYMRELSDDARQIGYFPNF